MDHAAADDLAPLPPRLDGDGANSPPKPVPNVQTATVPDGATNEPRPPPLTSQPMTASNSTSSMPSNRDMDIAAPYGTRSTRNRGGASRPNYAEDREIEMDFEYQNSAKDNDAKKKSQQAAANTPFDQSLQNARKSVADAVFNGTNTLSKEHIPGTSTFSANPSPSDPPPSKKRKAAAAPATSTQGTPVPISQGMSYGQATTRGAAHVAAQAGVVIRDSNMLSFDGSGARLKDGTLVADDGTVLKVNGMLLLTTNPPVIFS